jgi:hypothetical protein
MSQHSPETWVTCEAPEICGTSQHTPEPWRYRCNGATTSHFESEVFDHRGIHITYTFKEGDARRIVACVNLLSGVSDEKLQEVTIQGGAKIIKTNLFDELERRARQRDELLAALRRMHEVLEFGNVTYQFTETYARNAALIAKCEVQV